MPIHTDDRRHLERDFAQQEFFAVQFASPQQEADAAPLAVTSHAKAHGLAAVAELCNGTDEGHVAKAIGPAARS
jgi:hypothetical protein